VQPPSRRRSLASRRWVTRTSTATREDEAMSMAAGAWMAGKKAAGRLHAETRGSANCLNVIASLHQNLRTYRCLIVVLVGAAKGGKDAPEHLLMGAVMPQFPRAVQGRPRAPRPEGPPKLRPSAWRRSSRPKPGVFRAVRRQGRPGLMSGSASKGSFARRYRRSQRLAPPRREGPRSRRSTTRSPPTRSVICANGHLGREAHRVREPQGQLLHDRLHGHGSVDRPSESRSSSRTGRSSSSTATGNVLMGMGTLGADRRQQAAALSSTFCLRQRANMGQRAASRRSRARSSSRRSPRGAGPTRSPSGFASSRTSRPRSRLA